MDVSFNDAFGCRRGFTLHSTLEMVMIFSLCSRTRAELHVVASGGEENRPLMIHWRIIEFQRGDEQRHRTLRRRRWRRGTKSKDMRHFMKSHLFSRQASWMCVAISAVAWTWRFFRRCNAIIVVNRSSPSAIFTSVFILRWTRVSEDR